MKKLTSILAALFFAITAVFAQDSKSVEIDLATGTVKKGRATTIVWTTDSVQITQASLSLNGSQGAAGAIDETCISKPKLTDGQDFFFKVTSKTFPQIINIDITYEGTNHGGLVVGTSTSGGKVVADPSCIANLSTAENGTHKIKVIGGAAEVHVQNYSATPLVVTKIAVTCAVAGYVEEEEAQTDTATVTTMQELKTALGTRTKVVVLYKNLKPITKVVNGSIFEDYMPDGTTKLASRQALPADFDCYGTYTAVNGTFTVDSITDLHAFNNLYILKNYYEQNSKDPNILKVLNITEPFVVTGVEGANVFIQYSYARDNNGTPKTYYDQLVINGNHSLKVGDQVATFAAKYNKSTSLTLDEENTVLVRNAHFAVEATSFGAVTGGNVIKYNNISNITNLESNATKAVQLPNGGVVVTKDSKFFYTIGKDSLELRPATGVDLTPFVGKEANLAIKGIVDYCNTADNAKGFIVNSIKEVNTNYATIAEWLQAAAEGEGEGSLKNPVAVTLSVYQANKQHIFIGDETGGLVLIGQLGVKVDTIKTGYLVSGISGHLDLSDTKKAPQLSIPNGITIVDTLSSLAPVEVTFAQLKKEEDDAINNNIPAIKYANRLVKITDFVDGKNPDRKAGWFVQGKDTLMWNKTTLYSFSTAFKTTPMSVVAIADFRTLNTTNYYSIFPRSIEDVKDYVIEPVITPAPGTYYTDELNITITSADKRTTNIYYTFDPEIDPTLDECETYEGPIKITNDTTIWYAVEYGDIYSEVYSASYKFGKTVSTMEELKANEGKLVLYKGLEPAKVTMGEGRMSYTEYFMPDSTTALNYSGYVLPAKMDVYGTYYTEYAADAWSDTVPTFVVSKVEAIYAFNNMNDLVNFVENEATDEQKMASYEVKETALVTLAGPMSFYIQYEAQSMHGAGSSWKGLAAQTGRMTMLQFMPKAGDEITLKGSYNAAIYDDEYNMLQPGFFAVENATLVSENNKLHYTPFDLADGGLQYASGYYASLVRLSKGGKIVEDDMGIYYEFDFLAYVENPETGMYEEVSAKDSLVLMVAGPVDLEQYIGKELDMLLAGVLDYDAYSQTPILYVSELQESKLYYNTIAELIAAGAQNEYSMPSVLRNPVLLTYISYNLFGGYTIFVQDSTGAIAVQGLGTANEDGEGYTFPYEVAAGDSITGIEGFTSLEAAAYMWAGADYNVVPVLTKVADGEITPLEITLADFNEDVANVMDAMMMGGDFYLSEYANKVVRVQGLTRVDNPEEEKWPWLVQGEDTISVSTYYWGEIAVPDSIVSLTGIADYTIINGQTASIQPLNAESVVVPVIDNVEYATLTDLYVENGIIVTEGEFQIFTVTGQNVTNMNGRLTSGVYVVRTATAVGKVIIK